MYLRRPRQWVLGAPGNSMFPLPHQWEHPGGSPRHCLGGIPNASGDPTRAPTRGPRSSQSRAPTRRAGGRRAHSMTKRGSRRAARIRSCHLLCAEYINVGIAIVWDYGVRPPNSLQSPTTRCNPHPTRCHFTSQLVAILPTLTMRVKNPRPKRHFFFFESSPNSLHPVKRVPRGSHTTR